jgi:ADP-dependent NAD(P)H-hydrate dehydratase / NAD(P)H-hydrate epimerase
VTLATTTAAKALVHERCPEAIVIDAGKEVLGPDALYALADAIARADAVAVGPGIGTGDGQRAFVERLLATVDVPVVLDADALNVLAADTSPLSGRGRRRTPNVVITPHPAELARLLGADTDEVQRDRVGAARDAAARFAATVVLKGWRSVVAAPPLEGGGIAVCPTGGPELATAGTGDVLTGAIAGLGGGRDAARAAVYVHGLAGTVAGERRGRSGVVAWDVAEALPGAWERISAGEVTDWLS